MELLKLDQAYGAGIERSDKSCIIKDIVAIIDTPPTLNTTVIGKVFPLNQGAESLGGDVCWLLTYSLELHKLFAQPVMNKYAASLACLDTVLNTTQGAVCSFSLKDGRAYVKTDKTFNTLDAADVTDESLLAWFLEVPPISLSKNLNYSSYMLDKCSDLTLPYVTEWVEIQIISTASTITIPDGVKHVDITALRSVPYIILPDSVISCRIDKDTTVKLSIPKKLAKSWGYWSAVWGKKYAITDSFTCTPDELVKVRR